VTQLVVPAVNRCYIGGHLLPGVASFYLLLGWVFHLEYYKHTNNIQKTSTFYIFYICQMEKKVKPPYQVRMSEELYIIAMTKAKSLGLSFAAYVRYLISQDNNQK
jgi:hypothetical protein